MINPKEKVYLQQQAKETMGEQNTDMVRVMKIITNKLNKNVASPEFIRVAEIKSFREWTKTPKEDGIEGRIVLLVFEEFKMVDGKKKHQTMLINENLEDFEKRVGSTIVIR